MKWDQGCSHREVAQSLGVSVGAVTATLQRAEGAGLGWGEARSLGETDLEARLYPATPAAEPPRPAPDCVLVHRERRRKGVTLQLLHLEYRELHPAAEFGLGVCQCSPEGCQLFSPDGKPLFWGGAGVLPAPGCSYFSFFPLFPGPDSVAADGRSWARKLAPVMVTRWARCARRSRVAEARRGFSPNASAHSL